MRLNPGDVIKSVHTGSAFVVEYVSVDGHCFILQPRDKENSRSYNMHDFNRSFVRVFESDTLQTGNSPVIQDGWGMVPATAPIVPETLPCPVHLVPGLYLGKGCKTETLLIALQRRAEYYAGLDAMTPEERAKHYANIEAFKAMLPQPAPVAPEDLRRSFEAVARLNNEMYRWTSCMSYNGSYVGEPEGLLKRNIREIERILDRCKSDKGE